MINDSVSTNQVAVMMKCSGLKPDNDLCYWNKRHFLRNCILNAGKLTEVAMKMHTKH